MQECLLLNLKNQSKTQHNESTHKNLKVFMSALTLTIFLVTTTPLDLPNPDLLFWSCKDTQSF